MCSYYCVMMLLSRANADVWYHNHVNCLCDTHLSIFHTVSNVQWLVLSIYDFVVVLVAFFSMVDRNMVNL